MVAAPPAALPDTPNPRRGDEDMSRYVRTERLRPDAARRALAACLLLATLLPLPARPDPLTLTPEIQAGSRTLAGMIFAGGQSPQLLGELADGIGPRLTGSDSYARAVKWATDRFRSVGVADVRLEPVTLAHGWRRGSASAELLSPLRRTLHVAAYGWSPPTPEKGLTAPVVALADISEEAIAAAGVRGAIVLIDRAVLTGPALFRHSSAEEFARQRRYEWLDRTLAAAGAGAALVYSKTPNQVLRTSDPEAGGRALALPFGSIGREDALLIRRRLAEGPVTLELRIDTVLTGPVTVSSVIAEIRGRERPEEVVMLGAHLDSWDFATGAQDNGSGCAQVLEAARALAALGTPPRRTLRFALWASEEQGSNGSTAYIRAHAAEMKRVTAYLNTDGGAGRPTGWLVDGRSDIEPALAPLVPVLRTIGGTAFSDDLTFDTDSGAFFIAGVPALDLSVVDDDYDAVLHHKPADTLDKVDAHDLAAGAAMLAVTAYALAETPQRPLARLTAPDVESILKRSGALEYVRTSELRDLWHE
jgi:carboxypeptidase Q